MSQITYERISLEDHQNLMGGDWRATPLETKSLWGDRYTHYHYTKENKYLIKRIRDIFFSKNFHRWVLNNDETAHVMAIDQEKLGFDLRNRQELYKYLKEQRKKDKIIKIGANAYTVFIGPESDFSYAVFLPKDSTKKAQIRTLYKDETGLPLNAEELDEQARFICQNCTGTLPDTFRVKTTTKRRYKKIEMLGIY